MCTVELYTTNSSKTSMVSQQVKNSSMLEEQYNWVENPTAPIKSFITIDIPPLSQSQNIHHPDANKKSVLERLSANKSFLAVFKNLFHLSSILHMGYKEILIFYLFYVLFGALVYFGDWSVYSK